MGLYGALRVLVCGCQGLLPERWTEAAAQTSHAPMSLLPKLAMLLSDSSVCQPDAVWKGTCCLMVLPCAAPQSATALGTGLQLGAYLQLEAMCPALWSRVAGRCAGIATGGGMRVSGDPTSKTVRSRPSNIAACNTASSPPNINPRRSSHSADLRRQLSQII